jgi:oligopeptide/dipeptide ABC transporter ATP-binding protein
MYVGKIVEMAPTEQLFLAPKHPYTAALMSAVPVADPRIRSGMTPLQGEVPSPANPPSGCYFHPRCPYAVEICASTPPALEEVAPGRLVSCHRARELTLAGIGPAPAALTRQDQSSARPRPT